MKPSCLDAAYERHAILQGLNRNPVFPENKAFLSKWGQPLPKVNTKPYIHELVKEDIQSRSDMGKEKYKTRLQPDNGRDALKDAYEEALDLCQYLRQTLYERDGK